MSDSSDDDVPLKKNGGTRAKRSASDVAGGGRKRGDAKSGRAQGGGRAAREEPFDEPEDSSYSEDDEPIKKKQKTATKGGAKKIATKQKAVRKPQAKAKATPRKPAKPARSRAAKASELEEEVPKDARKYFKTAQKHITPPNGDGTRAFYESLYDENSNSLISLKFCIEHGVLNGTRLHEALPKFEMLRDLGAFKGRLGGLHPEFKDGLTEKHIKVVKKMQKDKGGSPRKKG